VVTLVHVDVLASAYAAVAGQVREDAAEQELETLAADLRAGGTATVHTRPPLAVTVADGLADAARAQDADLFVVGSSRRGRVARTAPRRSCSVSCRARCWRCRRTEGGTGARGRGASGAPDALARTVAATRRLGAQGEVRPGEDLLTVSSGPGTRPATKRAAKRSSAGP
jgi:hypothetical protein